jgi:formyl-CoA transferase
MLNGGMLHENGGYIKTQQSVGARPEHERRRRVREMIDERVARQVFEGKRVLDLGHIVAGTIAASVFADFGGEVIKVERPVVGDPLRLQFRNAEGVGLHYKVESRNKQSVTLDLKQKEGKQILRSLIVRSDVLVENFRPGVTERLGFGWEQVSARNPQLVMCRLSGFGQTGPRRLAVPTTASARLLGASPTSTGSRMVPRCICKCRWATRSPGGGRQWGS